VVVICLNILFDKLFSFELGLHWQVRVYQKLVRSQFCELNKCILFEPLLWLLRYTGYVLSDRQVQRGFLFFENFDQCVLTLLLMINIKLSNFIAVFSDWSAVEILL
jgi:hypothetical protein